MLSHSNYCSLAVSHRVPIVMIHALTSQLTHPWQAASQPCTSSRMRLAGWAQLEYKETWLTHWPLGDLKVMEYKETWLTHLPLGDLQVMEYKEPWLTHWPLGDLKVMEYKEPWLTHWPLGDLKVMEYKETWLTHWPLGDLKVMEYKETWLTHWPLGDLRVMLSIHFSSSSFIESYLQIFLGCCLHLNATGPYWSYVNFGSGNGLVPLGNKSLPGPILTQIHVAIWRH